MPSLHDLTLQVTSCLIPYAISGMLSTASKWRGRAGCINDKRQSNFKLCLKREHCRYAETSNAFFFGSVLRAIRMICIVWHTTWYPAYGCCGWRVIDAWRIDSRPSFIPCSYYYCKIIYWPSYNKPEWPDITESIKNLRHIKTNVKIISLRRRLKQCLLVAERICPGREFQLPAIWSVAVCWTLSMDSETFNMHFSGLSNDNANAWGHFSTSATVQNEDDNGPTLNRCSFRSILSTYTQVCNAFERDRLAACGLVLPGDGGGREREDGFSGRDGTAPNSQVRGIRAVCVPGIRQLAHTCLAVRSKARLFVTDILSSALTGSQCSWQFRRRCMIQRLTFRAHRGTIVTEKISMPK